MYFLNKFISSGTSSGILQFLCSMAIDLIDFEVWNSIGVILISTSVPASNLMELSMTLKKLSGELIEMLKRS